MISNGFIVIGLILFTYGATSLYVTKNTNIHNYILLSKSIKGMKKYKKELLNNFMIEFSNYNYTDMNEYNADTNKWTEYCEKEEVQNSIEYLKNQLKITRDNIIYSIVFKKNKYSEIENKKIEDKSKSWEKSFDDIILEQLFSKEHKVQDPNKILLDCQDGKLGYNTSPNLDNNTFTAF